MILPQVMELFVAALGVRTKFVSLKISEGQEKLQTFANKTCGCLLKRVTKGHITCGQVPTVSCRETVGQALFEY
jgi:hypothetical protein